MRGFVVPVLAVVAFIVINVSVSFAWTGPTQTPPSGNVAQPINEGTVDQLKSAGLGVNALAVFGNTILSGSSRYLNFGTVGGSGGYGIRDSGGILQFKNSGGTWDPLQTIVYNLVGGANSWTTSGNNIYNNNTGYVGIGASSPQGKLDVRGTVCVSNGGTYACPTGRMQAGSLTIGDTGLNYGGGSNWSTNTAGLLFEAAANTEIAVHDAGTRVASLLYFEGDATNRITIGRDMAWGAISTVVLNGNVGIGTQSPGAKLEVAGQVKITGGTPGAGKVLTSDATGLASWATPSSGIGGSGTANYVPKWTTASAIGNSLIYDNGSSVGIGTASPNNGLQVGGGGDGYANGLSIYSNYPTVYLRDGDGRGAMIHNNGSALYILSSCGTTGNPAGGNDWCTQANSSWPLVINLNNNDASFGGAVSGFDIYAHNWFRVNGGGGIYWQAYGSGWNMSDTTWIRTYGGAGIWANSANIGTNGTLTVGYGGGGGPAGGAVIAGNVGIGTQTPAQKLDVNGNVQATAFLYSSDRRLKENIRSLEGALQKLLTLGGVAFTWKSGTPNAGKQDVGVIAQDVQKVLPEAVRADDSGVLSVDYARLVPLLISAIKEQQQEIDDLRTRLDAYEARQ